MLCERECPLSGKINSAIFPCPRPKYNFTPYARPITGMDIALVALAINSQNKMDISAPILPDPLYANIAGKVHDGLTCGRFISSQIFGRSTGRFLGQFLGQICSFLYDIRTKSSPRHNISNGTDSDFYRDWCLC